jgi:hypothetical protein
MKNYTEVIEYIETVLNGNCIEIAQLEQACIYTDDDEQVAQVRLTIQIPLRAIPNG